VDTDDRAQRRLLLNVTASLATGERYRCEFECCCL